MPAGSIYELAILLTLKDLASGGLGRVEDRLRAAGREGRATLKTFQDLRSDLKRDLTVAGVGVASLALMRQGVKVAGDFETAIADLRMSIEELGADGKINVQKLAGEMNRLETLGIRIGNRLPGTTQDFIEMFSVLKQGGLQAKTIIDGAGESVANLAVVTHEIPKDLAEPFAQYAQQFQLTGNEAIKLADTLAKVRFATGLRPGELIEGSKFFQLRAGLPLGFTGLQGADLSGRLLATLRSYGLEGGIGGRELGGFMLSLNFNTKEKQKVLSELKSAKGIELQFFDKKGGFLGVENAFAQLEKFRKLSTQEQMKFGEKLFDREGMAIASVFMKSGVEGWQQINQRIDKVPPLQELINQKTETYNAKLEAVKGTLTNLEATAFTPMLNTLKPLLDYANQGAGLLQEWSKSHPGITTTAGALAGMGSITLTLVGGIGAMTTAWRLWRIASSVGVNEAGQLTFLRTLRSETALTSSTLATGATRAGLYGRTLGRIPSTVTTTVAVVGVEFAIQKFLELRDAVHDFKQATEAEKRASIEGLESLYALEADYAKRGEKVPTDVYSARAATVIESLNRQNELREALEPGSHLLRSLWRMTSLQPLNPYVGGPGQVFDPTRAAFAFRQRAPELAQPEVMRAFLAALRAFKLPAEQQGMTQLAEIQRKELIEAVQKAFPTSYQQATTSVFGALESQSESLIKTLTDLRNPVEALPSPLTRTGESAGRAAGGLDRFSSRLNEFDPRTFFKDSGYYREDPRPQLKEETFMAIASGSRAAVHHHHYGSITVNVPAGSAAANDPKELARMLAHEIQIQKERA